MSEINFDWDDLKLFLAVARAGGLAGAAVTTGKSPPTLGRRMVALEAMLGRELFVRQARGYALTEEGTELLGKAVELETQIAPLIRPSGKGSPVLVKISAGSWMSYALCQKAPEILTGNENARLRFISAEHVLDISRREAVIGIRNHRPEQRGLACRKVGQVRFAGYAISSDIAGWIKVLGNTPSAHWLSVQNEVQISAEAASPRNGLDLANAGIGRILLPTFIGDAQPHLQQVTPPIDDLTHEQWLVTHQNERFVPEVRRTIDRIYEVLNRLHKGRE